MPTGEQVSRSCMASADSSTAGLWQGALRSLLGTLIGCAPGLWVRGLELRHRDNPQHGQHCHRALHSTQIRKQQQAIHITHCLAGQSQAVSLTWSITPDMMEV